VKNLMNLGVVSWSLVALLGACGEEPAVNSPQAPPPAAAAAPGASDPNPVATTPPPVAPPPVSADCVGPRSWTFESGTLEGLTDSSGPNSSLLAPPSVANFPAGGKALAADVIFQGAKNRMFVLKAKLCPNGELAGTDLRGKHISATVRMDGLADPLMAAYIGAAGVDDVINLGPSVTMNAGFSKQETIQAQFPADQTASNISEIVVFFGYFGEKSWVGRLWLDDMKITD
jgi:hypothetical protein